MIHARTGAVLAAAAIGAGALAAGLVLLGRGRLSRWETLACDDCEEGDFVTLDDGTRMHYVARGPAGEDVILIHGLMSTSSEWSRNIEGLAQRHRVWAIDLIGFGYSSRVTEPVYSLQYLARSVREFMDARNIPRANLVGHSLGGAVALQFAHDYADRVNQLVLVDAAAYSFGVMRPVRFATHIPLVMQTVGAWFLPSPRVHQIGLQYALGDPKRLDSEMLAARMRATRIKGTRDALIAMAASQEAANSPQGLKEIQAPALILWGERDRTLPSRHGRRLARELPNAKFVIVQGAGHVPNEEFPDLVNRLILDFLDTYGARERQATAR